MPALILADRLGAELAPLTDRTCVALLPVVGKPVIEHALEALINAGIREAVIAVSAHADQVRAALGDGTRWGMRLDYLPSRGDEAPADLVQRLGAKLGTEFLALRGDVLSGGALEPFLEQARATAGAVVYGRAPAGPVIACLSRNGAEGLQCLAWPAGAEPAGTAPVIVLDHAAVSRLESLPAYYQANLDAMAGRFPGLIVPGREVALGLTVGRGSQVAPISLKQGKAFVGARCRVHPSAELVGEVVIADDVVVDRHVTLRSCVILPNTYVGEWVDVSNAIVRANDLIRVDTGAVLHVTDAFLLADLKADTLSASLAVPLNRLLGVALLLLSLPLWPAAALAALTREPAAPLRALRLRGNRVALDELGRPQRQPFTAWEWAARAPVLRYLPRLLSVAAGHLRVVGTAPLTPEQADGRTEEWELIADQAPAGLIGPTLLNLPADAPVEERLLSDAFYARQRRTSKDLAYLLQGLAALFSRRAWRPSGAG